MANGTRRGFGAGDINGFLGLVVDNLSILAFMAGALTGLYGVPAEIVFGRMFPGTALGVLLGNLAYTWMARRLAEREGRDDVTAMPLGLDTPTSFGMTLLVLGPAFTAWRQSGMDAEAAGLLTWQLGMASLVVIGLLKLALSFAGEWVRRTVPRAGLLGSIGGTALVLMGFLPLLEILRVPVVGLVGLGIVLYALVARGPMPFRLPGVLVAFLAAAVLYYALGAAGLAGPGFAFPQAPTLRIGLPWPNLGFVDGLGASMRYLPLLIPFAILMIVGGINVTESAHAAGDRYRTRDILLVEALATLVAGVCGGVAQTTPYIGQPGFKAMGARRGYTLLTGLFVGLGGVFGYLANLVELLPLAVLAPILVFVAISIATQAFEATEAKYHAAVVIAFFPALAQMLLIRLGDPAVVPPAHFAALFATVDHGLPALAVVVLLGNGFIITSMLWAGMLVALIDARPLRACRWLLAAAALTLFGVIHSAVPGGGLYLPWTLAGLPRTLAFQFAGAYCALAVVFALLALQRRDPGPGAGAAH
ncbi:hypothetical protein [Coralloluteibacterium stylophorae]|uniref:MFS transporter, AGZA family, xanthine/uracil permease n=1 Tax=Coralloluteibacterium stylophorae TaxID=1776034 RepID=A0A8J7VVH1_9GAMM|nr:hypothetical protein [Coralloluteibacterium stylophorae]MBS7456809.1 hypothetical protein [Coralloluteibacterium stylophorae]